MYEWSAVGRASFPSKVVVLPILSGNRTLSASVDLSFDCVLMLIERSGRSKTSLRVFSVCLSINGAASNRSRQIYATEIDSVLFSTVLDA